MKVSFHLDQEFHSFVIELDIYRQLMQSIQQCDSVEEATQKALRYLEDPQLCHAFVTYEFLQQKHREHAPKDDDAVCEYDAHL